MRKDAALRSLRRIATVNWRLSECCIGSLPALEKQGVPIGANQGGTAERRFVPARERAAFFYLPGAQGNAQPEIGD